MPGDRGWAGAASDRLKGAWEKLNARQKRFFRSYWLDDCRSATRAAERAGYSKKSAAARGSVLLHSESGREMMAAWMDEVGITPESILAEFHRINNTSLYDFRGLFEGKSLEDLHDAGIDLRQIKKLKILKDGTIEIEMYNRLKALVMQAKLLKMFRDEGDGLGASVVLDLLDAASDRIRTRPADVEAAVLAANTSGP